MYLQFFLSYPYVLIILIFIGTFKHYFINQLNLILTCALSYTKPILAGISNLIEQINHTLSVGLNIFMS
jgi:hypothetical protein